MDEMSIRVAGSNYRPIEAQLHFSRLEPDAPLTLKPDPENKYDENAVAVYSDEFMIGYVPKAQNQRVLAILAHGLNVECVNGDNGFILLRWTDSGPLTPGNH